MYQSFQCISFYFLIRSIESIVIAKTFDVEILADLHVLTTPESKKHILLLKKKDEEIEHLQKQLSFAHKQNEILEHSHASLLDEIGELNNIVASLQNSLKKIEVLEDDRKKLLEEKEKLRISLASLEKLYYEKNSYISQELQKMKEVHKEEASKLVSQIKDEASKQVENIKVELERKENDVIQLKTQIAKLLSERDQDILKIKIQYEDKIGKLKQQTPKSKMQVPYGGQMHDIFRQKYFKLEKESKEEICKLKEQIHSLQLLTESLKPNSGYTSLSSALLEKKSKVNTTTEVSVQTDNVFHELSRQFSNHIPDDDSDFVSNNHFNKTQSVLPQKRKLFNLNQNYFVR